MDTSGDQCWLVSVPARKKNGVDYALWSRKGGDGLVGRVILQTRVVFHCDITE